MGPAQGASERKKFLTDNNLVEKQHPNESGRENAPSERSPGKTGPREQSARNAENTLGGMVMASKEKRKKEGAKKTYFETL